MVLKLYKLDLSPPARAAMIACEIMSLEVEMIDVNLLTNEQFKPEFIKYYALIKGDKKVTKRKQEEIDEVYSFLEAFLSNTRYLASDKFTIADIAAVPNVTTLNSIIPIDAEKYPKTYAWLNEINKQPAFRKYNTPAAKELAEVLSKLLEFE